MVGHFPNTMCPIIALSEVSATKDDDWKCTESTDYLWKGGTGSWKAIIRIQGLWDISTAGMFSSPATRITMIISKKQLTQMKRADSLFWKDQKMHVEHLFAWQKRGTLQINTELTFRTFVLVWLQNSPSIKNGNQNAGL